MQSWDRPPGFLGQVIRGGAGGGVSLPVPICFGGREALGGLAGRMSLQLARVLGSSCPPDSWRARGTGEESRTGRGRETGRRPQASDPFQQCP